MIHIYINDDVVDKKETGVVIKDNLEDTIEIEPVNLDNDLENTQYDLFGDRDE